MAARPWGCFRLVSKDAAEESDHMYFFKSVNRIGREPTMVDHVVNEFFISKLNCVVSLQSIDEDGEPSVLLLDKSRNGIFVNEHLVGQHSSTELVHSATVHFTRPGMSNAQVDPLIYRFEILRDGLTPENTRLRDELDQQRDQFSTPQRRTTPAMTTTGTIATPLAETSLQMSRYDDDNDQESKRSDSASSNSSGKRERDADASETSSNSAVKRARAEATLLPSASTREDSTGTQHVWGGASRPEDAMLERLRTQVESLQNELKQKARDLKARDKEITRLRAVEAQHNGVNMAHSEHEMQLQERLRSALARADDLENENASLRVSIRLSTSSASRASASGSNHRTNIDLAMQRALRAERRVHELERAMQQSHRALLAHANFILPFTSTTTTTSTSPIDEVLSDLAAVSQASAHSSDHASDPTPNHSLGLESTSISSRSNGTQTASIRSSNRTLSHSSTAPDHDDTSTSDPPLDPQRRLSMTLALETTLDPSMAAEFGGAAFPFPAHSSTETLSSTSTSSSISTTGSMPPRVAHVDATASTTTSSAAYVAV